MNIFSGLSNLINKAKQPQQIQASPSDKFSFLDGIARTSQDSINRNDFWDAADYREAEISEMNKPQRGLGGLVEQTKTYNHPIWDEVRKINPKAYQEALSGTQIASESYDDPQLQQLLMDKFAIEVGDKLKDPEWMSGEMKQIGGGPGRGWGQFELINGKLPEDFEIQAQAIVPNYSPQSATDSAKIAADQIVNRKMLSRWGTPGSSWGSLDATRRQEKDRLTKYYDKEYLNQYLKPSVQFK